MAKEPAKLSVFGELLDSELIDLTNEAWAAAKGAQAKLGLNHMTGQRYNPKWQDLSLRKKQAVISENLCGVMAGMPFRYRFAEWACNNPGDAMRLFVALAPKTVEVDIEQRVGVLLVPKTSGSLQEWMRETNVLPPESQAHLSANDVFRDIAAIKGVTAGTPDAIDTVEVQNEIIEESSTSIVLEEVSSGEAGRNLEPAILAAPEQHKGRGRHPKTDPAG